MKSHKFLDEKDNIFIQTKKMIQKHKGIQTLVLKSWFWWRKNHALKIKLLEKKVVSFVLKKQNSTILENICNILI